MKNISRRDFLKGALAGTAAAALSTVTGIPAYAEEAKLYTPGTYTASAKGIASDVKVTMEFSETEMVRTSTLSPAQPSPPTRSRRP